MKLIDPPVLPPPGTDGWRLIRLPYPAGPGGQLSFATLSPAGLASHGLGTFGVLAVVAVLGFVGFEQAPVLGEEALFAAAKAFHNCTWRYIFALRREHVLPAVLGRTGGNNIPKAASLQQSATGLVVMVFYAALVLLALTAVAVLAFFARGRQGETTWATRIAPVLAAVLLGGIVILAIRRSRVILDALSGLIGPGMPGTWKPPASATGDCT